MALDSALFRPLTLFAPGTIDTSEDGFIQLTGKNVDLRNSLLEEEVGIVSSNSVNVSINSEGAGFNTNAFWDPFIALTATNAYSSLPDNLYLSFPNSYFGIQQQGPSNMLVRAVFLVNANTNVPSSVYIAPAAFNNEGALIQWNGSYVDPSTGLVVTNYLYLFHYFFYSTNLPPILSVGQIPTITDDGDFNNFLWTQSTPYPGLTTPTTNQFQNVFISNIFTNIYEYFNSTLNGTTTGTNASATNPSGSLTNLPSRIQITASGDLKLANAQISGENYLSINAPKQFDGSAGAVIGPPYADINLGVTNGTLTISNLIEQSIPTWSGTLNEWSTRWTNTDVNGVTWDYRVMLVYADLNSTLTPQVQNLTLNATNLVISDALNVFGSTFANAQTMTLTTNAVGNGAQSLEGELNMQVESPLVWSWNGSFPYLQWLTNNGVIFMPNYSDFISSTPTTNITAAIPAVQASDMLQGITNNLGINVGAGATVTIDNTVYTFVNTVTNTIAFQVKVGANILGSMNNLIAAINAGTGSGTSYSSDTPANSVVSAGSLTVNSNFTVMAKSSVYPGASGNGLPISSTAGHLIWATSGLTGGMNGSPATTNVSLTAIPYGSIVNNGYIADQGASLWVKNFVNSGIISNGLGSFLLSSRTATLTNGSVMASGEISLYATNTLLISNVVMQAGSLSLSANNWIWDGSVSNGNFFAIGTSNGSGGNGLILPFMPTNTTPVTNNLLGTTISIIAPPPNKAVNNTWAGRDYGINTLGYTTNNMAIGQLVLNVLGSSSGASINFSGPPTSTTSNAIYVDRLILLNYASYANGEGTATIPTLGFNINPTEGGLTIYYADCLASSTTTGGPLVDVSPLVDNSNGGHLHWVPQYAGYFSGTNVAYPNGTTNLLNIGLIESGLDSAGYGVNGRAIPNYENPTPVFVQSEVNFHQKAASSMVALIWNSVPSATNYIYYTTNLTGSFTTANWICQTNFVSPSTVPPVGGWPITNTFYETISPTNPTTFYRVRIDQNSSVLYGQ